jgi:hypothetical protein
MTLVLILIGLLVCALFGSQVAEAKRAGNRGFWLGLFLGPAGVIAAGFVDQRPQCLHCGGRLNDTADVLYTVCPHCRADLGTIQAQKAAERMTQPPGLFDRISDFLNMNIG